MFTLERQRPAAKTLATVRTISRFIVHLTGTSSTRRTQTDAQSHLLRSPKVPVRGIGKYFQL